MIKVLSCAAVLGLLVASSSSVLAKGGGMGGGASSFSPGHRAVGGPPTSGPTAGFPGASGYAPGRVYNENGRTTGHGASVYAPGFLK